MATWISNIEKQAKAKHMENIVVTAEIIKQTAEGKGLECRRKR